MPTEPTPFSLSEDPKMGRYAPLGLLANPFAGARDPQPGVQCEIEAAGNRLLRAIHEASLTDAAKPIRVDKNADLPPSYALAAISHAERSLATDDSLNVLYAYVQLFMFKVGVTRATLNIIAERLVFRDVEDTLISLVRRVLVEPDESLASFAVVGPGALHEFEAEFADDPLGVVRSLLGEEEIERREEFIGVADPRREDLDEDVDEDDATPEVDETVGDALGTTPLVEASGESDQRYSEVLDYIVEYVRVHLSPVIGRGLRVYKQRGLSAFSEELKVTKAPRKTLARLAELSLLRYNKLALIYDDFGQWMEIPADLRSQLVASMANIRWQLSDSAVMVLMLADGEAPELEETFSGGGVVRWHFDHLLALQENPDFIDPSIVNDWLASATLSTREPLTLEDGGLSRLSDAAAGSLSRFLEMAATAIEHAASRQASCLDDAATDYALSEATRNDGE